MTERPFRLACIACLVCAFWAPAASAQQFDPAYRFRTLQTEHFFVHFHQGEDALAGRLAAIAEETWPKVKTALGRAPSRTHVILIDQTDTSNGWATPLPRDTIAIYAVWPAASDTLKTDDWLRLVFTHEFTHIAHLDRSDGWARGARRVFGRTPLAFPNVFLPIWQIEGIAVYEESLMTGQGRLHAGDFRAIVDEAARARTLLPIDRVNGGLTHWPAGAAPYAYGLGFHAFLADQYGPAKLGELADRTSRGIPYFGSFAFKGVFGKSLGTLWHEYETAAAAAIPPAASSDRPIRLTHHNFEVVGPRWFQPSCSGCPPEVYYSVYTPDEFPSIYKIRLAGGSAASPERVTSRFLGSTLGPARDRLYFDQQEFRRNAGTYSDLYSLDPATGHVRRLTSDVRLIDPDASPDGRTLAAVQIRPGQRDLVLVQLASADHVAGITTLASEPETQFNAPRWSRDGRSIVVERQRRGEQASIVVIDAESHDVRVIASEPHTRWSTPTWRPDGSTVIAAAATDDETFNLFEIDLGSLATRQLTHTTGGATWPDVAPDGSSIVYVGYTAEGFDLYQIPYVSGSGVPGFRSSGFGALGVPEPPNSGAAHPEPRNLGTPEPRARDLSSSTSYSPWSTLRPTSWLPIANVSQAAVSVGAETAGADVLGYHHYSVSAAYRRDRPDGVLSAGSNLDWHASYTYARWRPAFFVSTSSETSLIAGPATDDGKESSARLRERQVDTGVFVPFVHARASHVALVSFVREQDRFTTATGDRFVDRGAARFGWRFRSAHQFGNSTSSERGVMIGATAELVRSAFGSLANATVFTADARAYLPGPALHHVLALRVGGGAVRGERTAGRTFFLGGADPNGDPMSFDSTAFSLLRGFPEHTFAGSHALVANIDYRWPLLSPQRGVGVLPVFLHTLHAAVVGDIGHVWTRALSAHDLKTSVGAEISANVVAGYWSPFSFTAGVARGHDGRHSVRDRTTYYVRVGYAF